MPEGPEVETIRVGLEPVIGTTINSVTVADEPKYFKGNEDDIKALLGYRITKIERKGKFLVWHFERDDDVSHALNHLGMTGTWHLYGDSVFDLDDYKHFKVYFTLSDGSHLLFICIRKFGKFRVLSLDNILSMPSIANLGPDILEIPFNAVEFKNRLVHRKIEVGKALLNSAVVAGCGNIYKSEALFKAGINPFRSCNSLSLKEVGDLAVNLTLVAQKALKFKGSSLKDFKQVDGFSGMMQNNFKVYGKEGDPCGVCSSPIIMGRQGDRSSFYCNICQH